MSRPYLKEDEAVLASLGYKQEFKRDFRAIEIFGMSFSIIGIAPSVASVLVYSLVYGTFSMVWGWAIVSVFLVFVGLAIAELGSSMPTSGGVYYWTYYLSSPQYRTLLCWLVGYMNTLSYVAAIAGVNWACAVEIMAAVSIQTNLAFSPTAAQIYGVYLAIIVAHCMVVSMSTKVVARLQFYSIFLNIALVLIFIIGIPAATPSELKNSASFALGHFENSSGWPNGFAFILSFLAPLWTIGGFDSTVHISEEARNAKTAVPWGIVCAVVIGCVLGFIINIVLVFYMGQDLAGVLASPVGQPMATILLQSFGKTGALVIWAFIIVGQMSIGISLVTISSRQNFAFSRDGGFPFSKILYHLNSRVTSPIYSVWLSGFMGAILALLAFAGETATGALFTLAVIGQFSSISTPIAARLFGGQDFRPGPFDLGKFGKPIGATALLWMIFAIIVMLFPSSPQSDAADMNYSVVVWGGVIILALSYFYLPKYGGIYWFRGPVTTVSIYDVEPVEKPASSDGIRSELDIADKEG